MATEVNMKDLRANWAQAVKALFLPIFIFALVRWAIFEPFVIPSGSMIPNLLIHDHILVKKFSYGLKIPFSDKWIIKWGMPKRGEIAVFKYPQKPGVYFIKRTIGLPGDELIFKSGQITVNGDPWKLEPIPTPENSEEGYDYYKESSESGTHTVRYRTSESKSNDEFKIKLKTGEYFMMGDNRDDSLDSRFWGTLNEGLLVGRAWKIIIGCGETLPTNSMICDPITLKKDRFWKEVSP
jgi:signal peptidase I